MLHLSDLKCAHFFNGARQDHFREEGVGADWLSLPEYFKEHGMLTLGSGKVDALTHVHTHIHTLTHAYTYTHARTSTHISTHTHI